MAVTSQGGWSLSPLLSTGCSLTWSRNSGREGKKGKTFFPVSRVTVSVEKEHSAVPLRLPPSKPRPALRDTPRSRKCLGIRSAPRLSASDAQRKLFSQISFPARRDALFLSNPRESREGSSPSAMMHRNLEGSGHASQAQTGEHLMSREGSRKRVPFFLQLRDSLRRLPPTCAVPGVSLLLVSYQSS